MSKDQDHRQTATHILYTANKVVTTERGGQHGGAEDSFQMIADLWMVYLNHTNGLQAQRYEEKFGILITPKDVALMMDMLKTARHTYGDPSNEDNFVDKAGYTGLAAALAGIKVGPRPTNVRPPVPAPSPNDGSVPVSRPLDPAEKTQVEVDALKAREQAIKASVGQGTAPTPELDPNDPLSAVFTKLDNDITKDIAE